MDLTRRSLLKRGAGATAIGTMAGCLDAPDSDSADDGRSGYAAFFTLWDWAEQIAGNEFDFSNPVAVGEMGHGWEPDGDFMPQVASTDVFLYLDTPEFSWAQNVAAQLEADHDDVVLINGMEAIPPEAFLSFSSTGTHGAEPDNSDEFDPSEFTVAEFELIDPRSDDVVAYWHDDHWHGGVPDVPVDDSRTIDLRIEDTDGRVPPLGDDGVFQFDARLADNAPDGLVEIESHGDRVELHGESTGQTLLVFELRNGDEVVFDTAADETVVSVVESVDEEEIDEFYDPHVWTDPILAQRIVEEIATELAALDPDNAETFEENAEAYNERLQEVDRQLTEVVDDAERTVAVFAGHDSFQYLEHRYGFELHTPVGVSPDAAESLEDVATMATVIEEHGIDTVLYDPFEVPDPDNDVPAAVETLLENTSATEYAPLTPAEGTTPQWNEEGYGWVEQMEEINVPSLRMALGAD